MHMDNIVRDGDKGSKTNWEANKKHKNCVCYDARPEMDKQGGCENLLFERFVVTRVYFVRKNANVTRKYLFCANVFKWYVITYKNKFVNVKCEN